MKSREIREAFLRFFEGKDHVRVPSAPVVPQDDPTLYFTNAGMNQFKDVFLGLGRRDYTRAVDTQKVMRVSGKHNDLAEVGYSPWHHTFFEMLGNWSFGDYFKKEAIEWGWELITGHFGLEKERLWATVFVGDDAVEADAEAEAFWYECTDLLPGRVVRLPAKENFWEMGATGPCGPCSEIHYYLGDDLAAQDSRMLIDDTGDLVEIWNLVFIQYNRDETGALQPLPEKHVDTGMGFERMCSLLQGAENNYETDVFQPLIGRIAELTGKEYGGEHRVPMQVIADHVRALCFTMADGAMPSNEGRGYVLRRILRRAVRYARQLDQHDPVIHQLVGTLGETMGHVFPEIVARQDHIARVIHSEEESFGKTLDRGLDIFARFAAKGQITGGDAFQLYDTYGFPLDLTELMAREQGIPLVEREEFDHALEAQRQRARQATHAQFSATEGVGDILEEGHSLFVGYDELEIDAQVVHAEGGEDSQVWLVLDRTPFYAEAGGQVGDRGRIEGNDFAVEVEDVKKARGGIVHRGRLVEGETQALTGAVDARVDRQARMDAERNHTATHLLHESLRQTLGDHVGQMGSLVAPDRLRFDFSHFAAVAPEQLREIEERVNEQIRADLEVSAFQEELEKAKAMGAQALFGEKYEDQVRVVRIGDFSLELCGGTHVRSTGEIGAFDLFSESGIAAGVRRSEALTGEGAERIAYQRRQVLADLGTRLNAAPEELANKIEALLGRNRQLERSLDELRRRVAALEASNNLNEAREVQGIKVVAQRTQAEDVPSLRAMADGLRESLGSGVGVLGADIGGKVSFIAVVTDDLIKSRGLKAGDIVRGVAQLAGGSGGGKPHLAQAGGRDPGKLDEALEQVAGIVEQQLK
ncbi:MAG: alanine--tRNA ligase [Gemmatimonadetes bacterium]|nr:alanine--tRNA ligase [Gemmatimonadota bacterium]MXY81092.1 alanine--tRNA ligase [Gemmatimonadota bacterium]MYB71306.1 alanine--tRNA ligase [Gemmatimonadota bacterium]